MQLVTLLAVAGLVDPELAMQLVLASAMVLELSIRTLVPRLVLESVQRLAPQSGLQSAWSALLSVLELSVLQWWASRLEIRSLALLLALQLALHLALQLVLRSSVLLLVLQSALQLVLQSSALSALQ